MQASKPYSSRLHISEPIEEDSSGTDTSSDAVSFSGQDDVDLRFDESYRQYDPDSDTIEPLQVDPTTPLELQLHAACLHVLNDREKKGGAQLYLISILASATYQAL